MSKHEALVSIIIPVWNTADGVEKLIRRLFEQTYRNLEIIAIDDGSTDNSLQILQQLATEDGRLKVIHRKNGGASVARNVGIEAAHGKYVIFVDSDDDVAANFVEKMVQAIEANPEAVLAVAGLHMKKLQNGEDVDIYTKVRRKQRKNERWADYILELLILDGRMHSLLNKIFKLDVIKNSDIRFAEGWDFAEDLKFVLDYLQRARGEIVFVPEAFYIYNFGTETSTVKTSSTIWENWRKSYADLRCWAKAVSGGSLNLKTRMLLELVLLRWRISHRRAQKRANSKASRKH